MNNPSVHTFATQAAAEVYEGGAVQSPSDPLYWMHVIAVPKYVAHVPNYETHPAPVVTQPI